MDFNRLGKSNKGYFHWLLNTKNGILVLAVTVNITTHKICNVCYTLHFSLIGHRN